LLGNDWYEISPAAQLDIRSGSSASAGGSPNFEREYGGTGDILHDMQGVRANFKAKILEMKLPFIGNVTPEDGGFTTRLTAILIREVSQSECMDFMDQRRDELWNMGDGRFTKFRKSTQAVTPWEDNGC
jgi:hypothetical protein